MAALRKVQVWILIDLPNKQAVLLLKTSPQRGSFWQPVTGSVEKEESDLTAALREATEETGLKIAQEQLQALNYSFSFFRGSEQIEETVFFVKLNGTTAPAIMLDNREHSEFKWCSLKQAMVDLKFDSNRKALSLLITKGSSS